MRCSLCNRFYERLARIRVNDNQVHAIYLKLFKCKHNHMGRRAFIVRSHARAAYITRCDLSMWIKQELHAMRGPIHLCPKLGMCIAMLGPARRADMNPVKTFTQEYPHSHRLAIPRCITCPLYVKWARHIYNLATTHRT